MKNIRRIICSVLVAVMMSMCLSGCGNKAPVNADIATKEELDPKIIGDYGNLKLPIDDEYTQVSIIYGSDTDTINDSVVMNELRRRTGLNIKVVCVPAASMGDKSKTMLASKNATDIFGAGLSIDEQNEFGMQGAFIKIDENLKHAPNFKKMFFDKPEEYGVVGAVKNMSASDGHLYFFPQYDINRAVNSGTMYRKDIFDKHGLKADWKNPEEFYQTLKKLKELYPNSTPFAVKLKTQLFTRLGESWGLGSGSDVTFPPFYDEADGKWKYYATDPRFKEIIDYVKKLFDEGLLDPEFLTTTDVAWTAKMTQKEKAFVTSDWIGRMEMWKEQTKTTVPEFDLRYAPPIGPTGKVIQLPKYAASTCVTNNERSHLALALNDYLLTESGGILLSLGVEGVTYTIGEDGFADYVGYDPNEAIGINELATKYGLFSIYRRFDKRSTYYNFSEREQEAQDMALNKEDGFEPIDPKLTFTDEEIDIRAGILPELSTAAEEFATKYVLGSETGDAAWEKWLGKAKKLGEDKVLKIYNDAQKRYDEM